MAVELHDVKLHLLYHTQMVIDRIVPTLEPNDPLLPMFKEIQSRLVRVLRHWRAIRRTMRRAKRRLRDEFKKGSPEKYSAAWKGDEGIDALYAIPLEFDDPRTKDEAIKIRRRWGTLFKKGRPGAIGPLGYADFERPDHLPTVMSYPYKGMVKAKIEITAVDATITEVSLGEFEVISGNKRETSRRFQTYRVLAIDMVKFHALSIAKEPVLITNWQKDQWGKRTRVGNLIGEFSITLECHWLPSRSSIVPGMREFLNLKVGNFTTRFEMWRGRGNQEKIPLVRAYAEDSLKDRRTELMLHPSSNSSDSSVKGGDKGNEKESADAGTKLRASANESIVIPNIEEPFGMCFIENALSSILLSHTRTTCVQYPTTFDLQLTAHTIYPACLGMYPAGTRFVLHQESIVEFSELVQESVFDKLKRTHPEALPPVRKHRSMGMEAKRQKSFTPSKIDEENYSALNTRQYLTRAPRRSTSLSTWQADKPVPDIVNLHIKNDEQSFIQLTQLVPSTPSDERQIFDHRRPRMPPASSAIKLPVFSHQSAMEGLFRQNVEEAAANHIDHAYQMAISDPNRRPSPPPMAYQSLYGIVVCTPNKTDWYEGGFEGVDPGTKEDLTSCRDVPNGAPTFKRPPEKKSDTTPTQVVVLDTETKTPK